MKSRTFETTNTSHAQTYLIYNHYLAHNNRYAGLRKK